LAAAILAGPWTRRALLDRLRRATGSRGRWRSALVRRLFHSFGDAMPPHDFDQLVRFLDGERHIIRDRDTQSSPPGIELFWHTPVMMPHGGAAARWDVPAINTTAGLAEWLDVSPGQLDWLADLQGRSVGQPEEKLRHYRHLWVAKRAGRLRLLEIPKARLKAVQRRILHDILDRIPAHPAAHAFRADRSVATYARPHAGRAMVVRLDLRDFFPSVPAARVYALFRTAGYPPAVARYLTGLCTTSLPADVWHVRPDGAQRPRDESTWERYRCRHLPQGAPTSPALANLCAYRLDARLTALTRALGAEYTRYADDLAVSGDDRLARSARRFQVLVGVVAAEEGFELNYRKTRFLRRGVRQQLAGVVVNEHPNVLRVEYDRIKAVLTNSVRHGPASQNRDGRPDFRAYLLGKISFVAMLNPARGVKLRRLFDAIAWPAGSGD
jgi:hypothetical protein